MNFMVFLCLLSKLTLLLIDLLYLLQAYLGEVEKVTRVSFRPVQNQRDEKGAGSPLLARTEYVEAALIELERERLTRVQVPTRVPSENGFGESSLVGWIAMR